LPAFGADGNPVDMTPQMEPAAFGPAVRLVLEADEVAGAIAIDVGLDVPAYGEALVAARSATGKPVVGGTAAPPAVDRARRGGGRLRAGGIPTFPTPERAVRAYRALHARGAGAPAPVATPRRRPALAASVGETLRATEGALPHAATRALLAHYGIRFPGEGLAASLEEARSIAARIGFPVAVKTTSAAVLHKAEAGGGRPAGRADGGP